MMYFCPNNKSFVFEDTGYPVDDDTRDAISASITGGGEVWIEDGVIKTSGAAPSPVHEWKNGQWRKSRVREAQMVDARRAVLLRSVAEAAQSYIEYVAGIASVPQFERDSWATQAMEAQAWAANPEAQTPLLARIAQARGVPLDELRVKALAKAQAFAALTAQVAGQRQALEDAINAAASLEALDAITITFGGGE